MLQYTKFWQGKYLGYELVRDTNPGKKGLAEDWAFTFYTKMQGIDGSTCICADFDQIRADCPCHQALYQWYNGGQHDGSEGISADEISWLPKLSTQWPQ